MSEKFDHERVLTTIPELPGCYIMKDKKDKIVYIGKAKNLKKRVKNYFQKSGDNRRFIKYLGNVLSDIEITTKIIIRGKILIVGLIPCSFWFIKV